MYTYAPPNYTCPICLGVKGIESDQTLLKKTDLIYQDENISAFINSFWVGRNEGHVIVVPNAHHENLYELPNEVGHQLFDLSKTIALAMKKVYNCDGTTLRQNNEPAGDQHALHYHLHIFPRFEDDNFNKESKHLVSPDERAVFAEKLKYYLGKITRT